jgi:hypothetical protein
LSPSQRGAVWRVPLVQSHSGYFTAKLFFFIDAA